jgi:hypothetical protein
MIRLALSISTVILLGFSVILTVGVLIIEGVL